MILRPTRDSFELIAPNGWGKSSLGLSLGAFPDAQAVQAPPLPSELNYWLSNISPTSVSLIPQGIDRRFSATTVLDYLTLSLVIGGNTYVAARKRASSVFEKLALNASVDQAIWSLYGGEEQIIFTIGQMLQVGRSARGDHLLICDDPFMMLDAKRTNHFQEVVRDTHDEYPPPSCLLLLPRIPTDMELSASSVEITAGIKETSSGAWLESVVPQTFPPLGNIQVVSSLEWSGITIKLDPSRQRKIPDGTWFQESLNLVTGPNGSGKSLFAHTILQLQRPQRRFHLLYPKTSGRLLVNGRRPVDSEGRILRVGVIPQQIHRISHTVDSYISHFCAQHVGWTELESHVRDVVGAGESFGNKKLLYLFRYALSLYLSGCNVLIFDEPDTALDESNVALVRDITCLLMNRKVLVVVITHAKSLYGVKCNELVLGGPV